MVVADPKNDAKFFVACDAEEDTAGASFDDVVEGWPNGNDDPEEGTAAGVEGAATTPKGFVVAVPKPEKPLNLGTGAG